MERRISAGVPLRHVRGADRPGERPRDPLGAHRRREGGRWSGRREPPATPGLDAGPGAAGHRGPRPRAGARSAAMPSARRRRPSASASARSAADRREAERAAKRQQDMIEEIGGGLIRGVFGTLFGAPAAAAADGGAPSGRPTARPERASIARDHATARGAHAPTPQGGPRWPTSPTPSRGDPPPPGTPSPSRRRSPARGSTRPAGLSSAEVDGPARDVRAEPVRRAEDRAALARVPAPVPRPDADRAAGRRHRQHLPASSRSRTGRHADPADAVLNAVPRPAARRARRRRPSPRSRR